jgi:phosphate transport system substrate-binding protein
MKKSFLLALSVLALTTLAQAEKLVIKGSDTLGAKLVPQLSEAFKANNPGVTFEIAAEGSTTGIAALTDGTADIGMSSRRAKTTEVATAAAKGVQMKPTIVAYDGIEVIVNSANKVSTLTVKQIEQIFAGDVVDWSEVGGAPGKIAVYTRNTASGTYQDFKDLATNKRDYVGSSQKLAGNEQIVEEVSKNPLGVGYVGLAYGNSPGVVAVSVVNKEGKTVHANKATVRDKSYPYSRPTFYYTNGDAAGLAKKFIDFTLSPEGAKIVEQVGFVPVQG